MIPIDEYSTEPNISLFIPFEIGKSKLKCYIMLLSYLSVKVCVLLAFVKNQRPNGKVKKFLLFCFLIGLA